jgi:LPS O-antigen subunit length determinant protein (WzzB/FepE family)
LQEKQYIDDEIDLRELFKTIWEKKLFILVFTFMVTFISLIYVFLKNPIPIYQGKTYIEIGEVQSKSFVPSSLDNAIDLAEILKLEMKVIVNIPKQTKNLLEITFNDQNKEEIKSKLEESVKFIMNRHNEKAKFYENVIVTKQIGGILIDGESINKPKKALIISVSFVTGFILSIFIVFFMQFINSVRKEQ